MAAPRTAASRVAIAASGGRDSTALLHCAGRVARGLGIEAVALHVHHGLMPQADAWLKHVREQARRWGLGFAATRLAGAPRRGDSVEDWARRERYGALAALARAEGCSLVLLAHHRRDQAETFLLQALRGGGARGLAAMPRMSQRDDVLFARPWLALPRAAIETYLRRHRLRYVDDASNDDPRFARNRLRSQVWPHLDAAFEGAESALAQAAARAAADAAFIAAQAGRDMVAVTTGPVLHVPAWVGLSAERRGEALRTWLHSVDAAQASRTLLERLERELPACRTGRWPLGAGELRAYRGRLSWHADAGAAPEMPSGCANRVRAGSGVFEATLPLQPGRRCSLPGWGGTLAVRRCVSGGLTREALRGLQVRARSGGERFVAAPGAVARSLKKQYQARGVPAWERGGPLLVTAGGELVFAPGLGIDARHWARAGEAQWTLHWLPERVATSRSCRDGA